MDERLEYDLYNYVYHDIPGFVVLYTVVFSRGNHLHTVQEYVKSDKIWVRGNKISYGLT